MFCKITISKFPALFKIESAATNCSKIKLVIYQFAFCCFFFWGTGQLFKRSILISLFVVDFRRVLYLNTDESVSTVLIKYESICYILTPCMDFDHLVFEKVCFNFIKLSRFCFIYFFFLLLFVISFRFFLFFVFNGVRTIPPKALG